MGKTVFPLIFITLIIYLTGSYMFFFDHIIDSPLPATSETNYLFGKSNAPNQVRFVMLGDSLLAGVGATNSKSNLAYSIFQKLSSDGKNGELINLAIPGVTTKDLIKSQLPQAIDNKPTDVLLFIGVNDRQQPISDQTFKTNYQTIITQLKTKTSARIKVVNLPYLGSNLILLPPWNYLLEARTFRFNQIIDRLARANNLQLIDLYTPTRSQFLKTSDLYAVDQFHPSDKGYALWSKIINEN